MNNGGILTDGAICRAVRRGDITIEPFNKAHVNPGSYDLTLGDEVAVYTRWVYSNALNLYVTGLSDKVPDGRDFEPLDGIIDLKEEPEVDRIKIGPSGFLLRKGIGYLMHTVERIHTRSFVPVLDGKALALDTDIPTPTGWCKMGQLTRGDFVFSANGWPTVVQHVTATMRGRPCYRITFSDGTSVVADASHQWFVHPVDAKPSLRTTAQMAARTWRKGVALFNVHAVAVQGPHASLPIEPYTFGAWLGDGTSSSGQITVHDGDRQILEEIHRDGYSTEPRGRKGTTGTHIIARRPCVHEVHGTFAANGSMHSMLKALDVLHDKHIPATYKRTSYEQRWSLLQGLMDTDGTVHRDDQASITLTNRRLFEDVEELCRSLGLVTYRDQRPSKLNGREVGTAYRLTWRATPELFRLERKKDRVRTTAKWLDAARRPMRGIRSIERIDSVPVRCITVTAKDGLFLATRAFIPTHNSSNGRLFLKVHETAGYGDAGFDGQYTLEVTVQNSLRVYAGMRIAQIRFETMHGELDRPYQGRYVGEHARGPTASRAWMAYQTKG